MAQYSTDFSEYTTGVQPSDWTRRFQTTSTALTTEVSGAIGGKVLRVANGASASLMRGASWNAIDADADRDDVELLVKWRVQANENQTLFTAFGRGSGTTSPTYYGAGYAGNSNLRRLNKRVSGTFTSLGSVTLAIALNDWYWLRLRLNAGVQQTRIWADGASEPGTWDFEASDTEVTGVGWVGVAHGAISSSTFGVFDIDYFAVGTNGDTAPSPDAGGQEVEPAAGAVTVTGFAPGITQTNVISAATGAVVVNGFAPTVDQMGAITVDDDFERSSINASLSEVSLDTDGVTLIKLYARSQITVSLAATPRWLEPVGRVAGVDGLRPRFEFVPFSTGGGSGFSFQSWSTPQRPHFSYDGLTWEPFDAKTVSSTRLRFRHNDAFTEDAVFIARSWPRSVTRVGQQIEALVAAHPTKIAPTAVAAAFTPVATTSFPAQAYIAEEIDAETDELGGAVPATPLYAFAIDDAAYGTKPYTSIHTAGIHAGEDVGELVFWEFIDWLLGSSTEAVGLRATTRFIVYPMMNPAGRYAGYWRGAPGSNEDPNREWLTGSPTHDCVAKAKASILADCPNGARWGVDWHASPSDNDPVLGTANNNVPATVDWFDAVNARLVGEGLSLAPYNDPSEVIVPATSETIRGFGFRELGTVNMVTLESSERGGPLSPTIVRPYAEAIGEGFYDRQLAGDYDPESPTPATGLVAVGGYAPTITQPRSVAPGSGAAAFTGYALEVSQLVQISPVAGSVVTAGAAPQITQPRSLTAAAGAALFTGFAPTLSQTADEEEQYPLAGLFQSYPLAGQTQTYPLG